MSASVHRDLLAWLLKWHRKAITVSGHATYRDVTDNVQHTDVSSRVEYADKTEAVKYTVVS